MKKIGYVFSALVVLVLCLFVPNGSASGAMVESSNLNSYVDLGDLRYSMNTSGEGGGKYYFSLNLDTSCGVIDSSSLSITRDYSNPLRGVVNAYIHGLLDVEPTVIPREHQSTNVSRRGGLYYSTNVGIGSWQERMWTDEDMLVFGDIFSNANLSTSLSQIASVGYANASYREYDASTYDWTDLDGVAHTQFTPAKFYMQASWNVEFLNPAAAGMAYSMQPTTVSTEAVPEPSTLALVASGIFGLGFVTWRKRR